MKYMGSKKAMLQNGLGTIVQKESESVERFVDLFCGSAFVSWFAAIRTKNPVLAVDLQQFSSVLANSVIARNRPLDFNNLIENWLKPAIEKRNNLPEWIEAKKLDNQLSLDIELWSNKAKSLCSNSLQKEEWPVWSAYGGYYFSPTQSLTFDSMINTLPDNFVERTVCLASIIIAASQCAASPGHTAQPFKANKSAGKYLRESWNLDPINYVKQALKNLAPQYANSVGSSFVEDSNKFALKLKESDLVFIDPPYSSVHYSRFYHVLETIARGKCGPVSGVGRYPSPEERPSSSYSMKTRSTEAIDDLLKKIYNNGASAILTFPKGECSNNLSGEKIENLASNYFKVTKKAVKTTFSTLGGNSVIRSSRKHTDELILILKPI